MLLICDVTSMTSDLSTLQRYFVNKATEKARIRNITVNGEKATVVFSEYQAPESDIDDFHREDNSDGHFSISHSISGTIM